MLPKFVSQGAAMYHELLKRGTRIICLLVPLLLPKFVREGAAMYHELRKRGTSAADLKFLRRLRQTHFRNFKSKSGTRIICLLVPLLLPKFVREGAAEAGH